MTDLVAQSFNELTSALTALGIRHMLAGSLAAAAHGVVGATMGADLVASISPPQARLLARALGPGWYADPEMMQQAIRDGRSFNLVHMASAIKFDIFPASTDFHESQLERATAAPLRVEGALPCLVSTPEDILLAKLRWYRDGGEVSDRQWNDIGGLIAANAALDWDYVNLWAARLGVTDLLARARAEAEL